MKCRPCLSPAYTPSSALEKNANLFPVASETLRDLQAYLSTSPSTSSAPPCKSPVCSRPSPLPLLEGFRRTLQVPLPAHRSTPVGPSLFILRVLAQAVIPGESSPRTLTKCPHSVLPVVQSSLHVLQIQFSKSLHRAPFSVWVSTSTRRGPREQETHPPIHH